MEKLKKVFEKEYRKIDEKAEKEKKIISYFDNFINSNYDEILKAFIPTIQKEFKEKQFGKHKINFENDLYNNVVEMIKGLNNEALRIIGLVTYKEKTQTPDILIGFSEYFKWERLGCLGKKLTEKGVNEINSYRDSAGFVSIEEGIKIGKKRLEDLCDFQNLLKQ